MGNTPVSFADLKEPQCFQETLRKVVLGNATNTTGGAPSYENT